MRRVKLYDVLVTQHMCLVRYCRIYFAHHFAILPPNFKYWVPYRELGRVFGISGARVCQQKKLLNPDKPEKQVKFA